MERTLESRFNDTSDEFELDEASTDYLDGPLSGWLRRKSTNEWFAFDCQLVVPGLVWHWTLVPVEQRGDVATVLENASRTTTGYWVSIVEDRRCGVEGACTMVRIENGSAKPVVHSVRAREMPIEQER